MESNIFIVVKIEGKIKKKERKTDSKQAIMVEDAQIL